MEQHEIEETLREVGLNDEETKVYLSLLKNSQNVASKVSEETRINRSHTYQLLERLIVKGFVSYAIKENIKYFSAVHPQKIVDIVKEKEQKLQSILPALVGFISSSSKEKPLVEIFEGKEGIKTILNDILKVKEEWLAFGSSGKGTEVLPFFAEHWEINREKLKVQLRGIIDLSASGIQRGKELARRDCTQICYLDETYSYPSSTWIYGDRIALVVWDKEHSFAIRVVSNAIATNYKRHFEQLWKIAQKRSVTNT